MTGKLSNIVNAATLKSVSERISARMFLGLKEGSKEQSFLVKIANARISSDDRLPPITMHICRFAIFFISRTEFAITSTYVDHRVSIKFVFIVNIFRHRAHRRLKILLSLRTFLISKLINIFETTIQVLTISFFFSSTRTHWFSR